MLLIIMCCLTDLCFCLLRTCRTAPDCVPVLPGRLDQSTRDFQRDCSRICTFTVYISCSVMASGDDQCGQASVSTFRRGRANIRNASVTFLKVKIVWR